MSGPVRIHADTLHRKAEVSSRGRTELGEIGKRGTVLDQERAKVRIPARALEGHRTLAPGCEAVAERARGRGRTHL
jgi:hypothetical protein